MTKQQPADVLVVFGITGDLAKVMTFRSLYRLERRKLLDCPIVGVAVDDWDVDQLRQRARDSIVGTGEELDDTVFERFAARLSYAQGDFSDAETYKRVAAAIGAAKAPVFYVVRDMGGVNVVLVARQVGRFVNRQQCVGTVRLFSSVYVVSRQVIICVISPIEQDRQSPGRFQAIRYCGSNRILCRGTSSRAEKAASPTTEVR